MVFEFKKSCDGLPVCQGSVLLILAYYIVLSGMTYGYAAHGILSIVDKGTVQSYSYIIYTVYTHVRQYV